MIVISLVNSRTTLNTGISVNAHISMRLPCRSPRRHRRGNHCTASNFEAHTDDKAIRKFQFHILVINLHGIFIGTSIVPWPLSCILWSEHPSDPGNVHPTDGGEIVPGTTRSKAAPFCRSSAVIGREG